MTRTQAFAAVVATLIVSTSGFAQNISVRGYGETDLDASIRSALSHHPLVVARDTLIASTDTVKRNVLVLGSRLIVEGTIAGDLMGVEANVYLRPNAVVTGTVTNVAGGLYPSERARMGLVNNRPVAPYRLVRSGNDFVIEGTIQRPAVRWLGGSQIPEYNRVDGLRVELGPQILLPGLGSFLPELTGSLGYATERSQVLGRGQLLLRRGRSSIAAGIEQNVTVTNEEWIRTTLKNSLTFIWNGRDYRDYYEADRIYVEFRRFLEIGDRTTQFWLRAQREDASPLIAGDPFVIFKPDSIRANLFVPESRASSFIVGAQSVWSGENTLWTVGGELEFAGFEPGDDEPEGPGIVFGGDEPFNAYRLYGEYAMQAIANHTLRVEANFRGPLPGTDDLPLQRWTFVGGSGTLHTFDIAQFRGDRLAFVKTEYRIPLRPEWSLPILGFPTLRFFHYAGMAWARLDDRNFEQNVEARLQFTLAFVRVVTNPRNFTGDAEFDVGLSFPPKRFPWEPKRTRRR